MAAYNYYGQNYATPYMNYPAGYQPPMMQPQVQPQMPQSQMPSQQNSIIWVSGLAEAQTFPTAPNSAVVLWEQSGKTIFVKSADATGKPSIRIYDLVERTETASTASDPQVDKKTVYATKDDLAAVVGAIKGISGDIEQMKGDLYGVAGRKKATKKTETEVED